MDFCSSKTSEEPCAHQQHDFKQEIEDSIRRCEELLSMAPMSYQPPDGKSSGRKSSRSTTASARRSDGRSDVETVSSSIESDLKSAEVDPEWKKNMGLLINKQDGTVPHVSPRGGTPRVAASATPRTRERGEINCYGATDDSSHHESSPGKQLPVEEYSFSFDDASRNSESPEEENLEQSICIRARAILRVSTDEPGCFSGSDDWAYEQLGQASTPSTKTSHSELNRSKEELERKGLSEPLGLSELEAFEGYERHPEVLVGESQLLEQQPPQPPVEEEHQGGGCMDAFLCRRSLDGTCLLGPTESTADGDCTLHKSIENLASLARSLRSSRASHPDSPGRSPPKSPPGSPKPSGSNRMSSPAKKHRINENSMSFSFTIPNQPKYAENWEWLEECKGVDPNQDEVVRQPTTAATEIVLENGHMRIGSAKLIKTDLKRFKVQKKFRSQRDIMNSKLMKASASPSFMGGQQMHRLEKEDPGGKQNGLIPARLRHLSKPRTDLYQKFAHTRAQMEEEHMSECSFRPKVGRRPNPRSQYSAPLIQRVGDIEQRVDLRKRARKVIEKEELDQCSFWPQINSNSEWIDPAQYKPISERAMEYQVFQH